MTRVLLIKTSSLGDVVHNLPMVTDIHQHLQETQIDWVVEEGFADIPAMHPAVKRVITVATRRWRQGLLLPSVWRELVQFKRSLQQQRYDVVLDSQGLVKSAVIAWLAHGPAYGMDRNSARELLASRYYQRVYTVARGKHAVQRNRELAARAFGYPLPTTSPDYGICHSVVHSGSVAKPEILHNLEHYIVLLHGTSRRTKLWPENNWIALASYLAAHDISPVLPWGNPGEQARAQNIARGINRAIVLPKVSLVQLADIFRNALAVVGVDTGLVHLATALDRPTVAIYTDTLPELTGVLAANPARAVNLGGKRNTPPPEDVRHALTLMDIPR